MSRKKAIIVISIAGVIITVLIVLGITAYESKKGKNDNLNQVNMNVQKENTVINENTVTDVEKKSAEEDGNKNISIDEEEKNIENVEKTGETSKEKTIERKEKRSNEIIKSTQEKIIESPNKVELDEPTQTTEKVNTAQTDKQEEEKKEQPKQENVNQNDVIEKPKCTDTKHGIGVGNSDKWFNSYNEAIKYYDELINLYSSQVHNGEITAEEYYKLCPYGYETWSCPYCGKWTLNYYKR